MFTRCEVVSETGYFMNKEQIQRCLLFNKRYVTGILVSTASVCMVFLVNAMHVADFIITMSNLSN